MRLVNAIIKLSCVNNEPTRSQIERRSQSERRLRLIAVSAKWLSKKSVHAVAIEDFSAEGYGKVMVLQVCVCP